jgi:hypothetical protein
MNNLLLNRLGAFAISAACVIAAVPSAMATPYATAITNTGTVITFRLNESADSVKIIYNGGASTNDLGARAAGLQTVNIAITGAFQIEVNKTPGNGYLNGVLTQISSDSNPLMRFNAPRGVAVNRNPASAYFGRIYVSNADTGSVAAVSRVLLNGDGIFMLNADFTDAVGQGNAARTGGLNWRFPTNTTDQANKPFRIEVGEDDNLYISDYSSAVTNSGNLYVTDPNVSTNSGTNVFIPDPNNAGRIPSSAIVKGSLGEGNLTVYAIYPDKLYDYDFGGFPATSFSVMQRWDLGGGPLPSAVSPLRVTDLPILIADVPSVLSDIDIAPDGKYFIVQNRSAGNEAGLYVVDPTKDLNSSGYPDIVYDSLFFSINTLGRTNDLFMQTRAVKVSPDNSVAALVRDDNRIWIIPLVNGLPDIAGATLLDNPLTTTLGRDLSFDAAGNLYVASSGQAAVRVFTPGFGSRALTGSDGTFSIARITNTIPIVTITTNDANMYERIAGDVGRFTVSRVGPISVPLDVTVSYGGTAPSTDYANAVTTVTIPGGQITASVSLAPIDNTVLDGNRTVIVSIAQNAGYEVGAIASVTLQIRDDEQPVAPVVFADDFDSDTSGNYGVQFSAVNGVDDKTILFNYDYSADSIPSAPNSVGGTTRGLKLLVNKDATGSAAAVNLYPLNVGFSNDFALRLDMFQRFGASGTTEHSLFGINHSGSNTNRDGLAGSDGVWFAVETDGSASSGGRSYAIYTSTNENVAPPFTAVSARAFDAFFSTPPWAGIPGGAVSGQWADVEVIQTNNIITWKINGVMIQVRTNTSPFTSGTIMLGHMDFFNSVGTTNNFTVFDNVRVVNLTSMRPSIQSIRRAGGTIEIEFTGDPEGSYKLQSSTSVTGTFTDDAGWSVTHLNGNRFRAVSVNAADPQRFYRIATDDE